MPKWTPEQRRVLFECSQLGAKACRDLIRSKHGVNRSVEATEREGQRLGLSMKKTPNPCPNCGATENITRSGFCARCHYEFLLARQYDYRKQIDHLEERKIADAKRKYDAERKANNRYAKKKNLPTYRQLEEYGDFVDLSAILSDFPETNNSDDLGE